MDGIALTKLDVLDGFDEIKICTGYRIDGRDYPLRAWSPGGFSISPYNGDLVEGQIAKVGFVVHDYHDQDGALRVEDRVRIERIDATGLLARWWHLPERKKIEISNYFAVKASALMRS